VLQQAQEKNKLKIDLPDRCYDQSYYQAKEALLPGMKFMFQIPAPKSSNEIRIAIAGDSVTQGCCGTDIN